MDCKLKKKTNIVLQISITELLCWKNTMLHPVDADFQLQQHTLILTDLWTHTKNQVTMKHYKTCDQIKELAF